MISVKKIYLIFALSISFVGCASQINQVMSSWMNHHYSDLVRSWGAPHRIVNDRYGGQILIYYLSRNFTLPGIIHTQTSRSVSSDKNSSIHSSDSFSIYLPPQNIGYNASRIFWVNRRGIIYKWAWDGY